MSLPFDEDEQRLLRFIVRLAKQLIVPRKIILFGSRARRDHHRTSDFDLAFSGLSSPEAWPEFAAELAEEAPSLCEIDAINLDENEIDQSIRDSVEKEGVKIL